MRFIDQSNTCNILQVSFQLLYSIIALPGGTEVEKGRISLNKAIQNRSSPLTTQQFGAVRTVLTTGGVRVVCREGYFGPDCGCTPRDYSTGHFTCDVNGASIIDCLFQEVRWRFPNPAGIPEYTQPSSINSATFWNVTEKRKNLCRLLLHFFASYEYTLTLGSSSRSSSSKCTP